MFTGIAIRSPSSYNDANNIFIGNVGSHNMGPQNAQKR